jgi:ferredoxin-NADP reductase
MSPARTSTVGSPPDGYRAERSYAIASAPESAKVALTVERIDDGGLRLT